MVLLYRYQLKNILFRSGGTATPWDGASCQVNQYLGMQSQDVNGVLGIYS